MVTLPKGMPEPKVENFRKATDDQLREEFITLRMFTASLLMWCKDVEKDYAVLMQRLTEIQNENAAMRIRLQELEKSRGEEASSD